MDDIYEKLQGVLNDKGSMAQISELAKMLGNSSNNEKIDSSSGGLGELSSLLGGTGNNDDRNTADDTPFGSIDPAMLMKLGQVLSKAGHDDKNISLLLALRPMHGNDKQQKIDRIIKIFRIMSIYPALKDSGISGGDLFGLFK